MDMMEVKDDGGGHGTLMHVKGVVVWNYYSKRLWLDFPSMCMGLQRLGCDFLN